MKKRILVIDDKGSSTRMVCLDLEKIAPLALHEMSDTARMLAFSRAFGPDLILMDAELPGIDGATVWRRFRDDPAYRQSPIIFLTESTPEKPAAWQTDDNTFLLDKPLTLSKLGSCMARVLDGLRGRLASHSPAALAA